MKFRAVIGIGLLAVGLPALSAGVQIIGDNSAEVMQHAKLKDAAGRYIQTLDTEVKRISGMAGVSVDGATIAATSRKLGGLKQQGEQFGTTFTSPLDKCRSAGIYARMYWDVMAGFITTETPAKALATYRENARWCREQIATQPKPTVTIKAAAGKPPFQGCLRVLSLDEQPGQAVSWSCPKANVKL